ncbi:MAG: DNA polymerase III subunit chi [Gammaproteobacteria bacterium]|jgi:DNA polymerase-3 subunit chi|nr:DNA polymerase III subunit chi [Gammaproteobacteria bacterium]
MHLETNVLFHHFESIERKDFLIYVCKLIEKGYKQNINPIYIKTDTQKQAEELDKILWTFRQESYIPHTLVDQDSNNTQPVQIGWIDNEIEDAEAIINLSDGMPDISNHLKKIHEIIENIDEKKEKARERWKKYKSIGFNIKAYKVS